MKERSGTHIPLGFSPTLAFPALWLLGVGLAQIRILRIQGDWSATTWIVVGLVPVAFVAGSVLGQALVAAIPRPLPRILREAPPVPGSSRKLRVVLLALLAVGSLEAAHQFVAAGFVPLLTHHIDRSRKALPGGPTMLLSNALALAAMIALCVPRRLLSRSAAVELGVAACALVVLFGFGGRGQVFLPLAVVFIVRWLTWGRPPLPLLAVGAIGLVGLVAVLFYARTAQLPIDHFDAELYRSVVPSTPDVLLPLLPVHFGIALNFETLNHVVNYFPTFQPFGHGQFDSQALDRVLPTQDLSKVTAFLTPPWLVSTAAGPLWADGGLLWVVVGFILIGLMAGSTGALARISRSFPAALLFGYVLYLTLFCIYDDFFTRFVDWVAVAPGLFVLGLLATRWHDAAEPAVRPSGAGYARPRSAVQRLQVRLSRRRGAAAAAVAALFVVVVAAVVNVTDVGINRASTAQQNALLRVSQRVSFPPSVRQALHSRDRVQFASDGDLGQDNAPLWMIRSGARPTVFLMDWLNRSRLGVRRFDLPAEATGDSYDAGQWSNSDALFSFTATRAGVAVKGYTLDPRPVRVLSARVGLPALPPGVVREFSIATWSGPRPDLLVIERGSAINRITVRVLSGESRFSHTLLVARAPIRGAGPDMWSVDVAHSVFPKPDLVLVYRQPITKRYELHVLRGDTAFQLFGAQQETAVKVPPRPAEILAGTSLGSPCLYLVDRGRRSGELSVITIGAGIPVNVTSNR